MKQEIFENAASVSQDLLTSWRFTNVMKCTPFSLERFIKPSYGKKCVCVTKSDYVRPKWSEEKGENTVDMLYLYSI